MVARAASVIERARRMVVVQSKYTKLKYNNIIICIITK